MSSNFTRSDYEAAIRSVQQRAAVQDCDEDLVILDALRRASADVWQDMASAPKNGRSIMLWWPAWAHYPVRGYWKDGAWQASEAISSDAGPPLAWGEFPAPPVAPHNPDIRCFDDHHLPRPCPRCQHGACRNMGTFTPSRPKPTAENRDELRRVFVETIRLRPVNPDAWGAVADDSDAELTWRVTDASLDEFIRRAHTPSPTPDAIAAVRAEVLDGVDAIIDDQRLHWASEEKREYCAAATLLMQKIRAQP